MAAKLQKRSEPLVAELQKLLLAGDARTQDDLCKVLNERGFSVNQSKVSRVLRKIGAIKVTNDEGKLIYSLPKEDPPPSSLNALTNVVGDIVDNGMLVVVSTSPGAAPLIARILDYHPADSTILGVLAGDDTIFIAPKSAALVKDTLTEVKNLLAHVSK